MVPELKTWGTNPHNSCAHVREVGVLGGVFQSPPWRVYEIC